MKQRRQEREHMYKGMGEELIFTQKEAKFNEVTEG